MTLIEYCIARVANQYRHMPRWEKTEAEQRLQAHLESDVARYRWREEHPNEDAESS